MATKYCRHIRINGERCCSPALANKHFCYFHLELELRHRRCSRALKSVPAVLHPMSLQDGAQRDPILAEPALPFDLPPLEDRHSIQVALSLIITALAENRIDPKRAALLFYGLQIASSNAFKLDPDSKNALGKVSLTVLDESNGNLIAPEGDPEDYQRKGSATRYWEMLMAEEKEKDLLKAEADARKAEADANAIADAVALAVAEVTARFTAANALPPPTDPEFEPPSPQLFPPDQV